MKIKELYYKVLLPEILQKKLFLMLNWTVILTFMLVLKVSANGYSQNVRVQKAGSSGFITIEYKFTHEKVTDLSSYSFVLF
ncbi:MAG: hypothetical protein V4708_00670 [Bacteroidota bacterium]